MARGLLHLRDGVALDKPNDRPPVPPRHTDLRALAPLHQQHVVRRLQHCVLLRIGQRVTSEAEAQVARGAPEVDGVRAVDEPANEFRLDAGRAVLPPPGAGRRSEVGRAVGGMGVGSAGIWGWGSRCRRRRRGRRSSTRRRRHSCSAGRGSGRRHTAPASLAHQIPSACGPCRSRWRAGRRGETAGGRQGRRLCRRRRRRRGPAGGG